MNGVCRCVWIKHVPSFLFWTLKISWQKKKNKYLIEGKSMLENWWRLLKCSFLQRKKVMTLTLTLTPPLLFLSIPGSPFTPYNRNNKEHLACLQRAWENTSTESLETSISRTSKRSAEFKKSALYQQDNSDSPLLSATPKETASSSDLWAVTTAKQDIIIIIFVITIIINIIITCQNDWKAFKVYGIYNRDWNL